MNKKQLGKFKYNIIDKTHLDIFIYLYYYYLRHYMEFVVVSVKL